MSKIKDLTNLTKVGGKVADDLLESGEERQQVLSERHEVDMASDSWLSKNIRPGVLVVLLAIIVLLIILEANGKPVSIDTKAFVYGTFATAFGFYFESKKHERIAQKNAEANLKLQKMKAREERREARHERRQERKQSRNE